MNDHFRTPLITAAIEQAARNIDPPAGSVFHSDRSDNYTSAEFAAVPDWLGIQQSVGRTGICFGNSLTESFNAAVTVKHAHCAVYPTREKGRKTLPSRARSDTIGSVSIQRRATAPHKRRTTNI